MANTYNQILTRGLKDNLSSTPVIDGKIRLATDTQQLFVDFGSVRMEITDIIKGYTESQIRALQNPLSKIYLSSDTNLLMYYSGSEWIVLNASSSISPSTSDPLPVDVTAAVGTSTNYAREDHVHAITVTSSMINSTSDNFDMDFGELSDE